MANQPTIDPGTLASIFVLVGTVFTAILVWLGSRSKNQGEAIQATTASVISLTTKVADLITSQSVLERKITVLEDQKADLERQVDELKKNEQRLLDKIDELEASKYALADKVSQMEVEGALKDKQIAGLQAQIDSLTAGQSYA